MTSAGLLVVRHGTAGLEVLLAHPGGPYWARKDDGAWTLPKGELLPGEDPLAGAQREFTEETGAVALPPFVPLGEVRLRSGKRVLAWACSGEMDPAALRCNTFELEWPPRSGRRCAFPEIDRVDWFGLPDARRKIHAAQQAFIDRVSAALAAG